MGKQNHNKQTLTRKQYEKELHRLQVELCHLQEWVKANGLRVVVVFEGRDGAGKGGTIKAITERVSPRVFRVAALPAPSDREKSQLYIQRYMEPFSGRRRDRDFSCRSSSDLCRDSVVLCVSSVNQRSNFLFF